MSPDPVLHTIAGPNGAGKTTFYNRVLGPATRLPFINADVIAAQRWPEHAAEHSYDAARIAAEERAQQIADRRSFVAETVFSHESKLELLRDANAAGFHVSVHIVLIPEQLAVARVVDRVANGGHFVPEDKIRERFGRLWGLLAIAIAMVDQAYVYDNTTAANPFRLVASFADGRPTHMPVWPKWTPAELRG
ncbi:MULTISPECIES: zeta toxin family protein [Antrihabitans]|uniref:Zeta toxin family protein n=1 Tax=Antrihabitans spumae TaxID=3373370 RepID=A0ABW7JT91_9NOCA|nr:AAA family ATPase [Antrihabitans stalagmiti]